MESKCIIRVEKYTDLGKLLDYIPPIHHSFFKELSHHPKSKSKVMIEHPDIIDSDSELNLETENLEFSCLERTMQPSQLYVGLYAVFFLQ